MCQQRQKKIQNGVKFDRGQRASLQCSHSYDEVAGLLP